MRVRGRVNRVNGARACERVRVCVVRGYARVFNNEDGLKERLSASGVHTQEPGTNFAQVVSKQHVNYTESGF